MLTAPDLTSQMIFVGALILGMFIFIPFLRPVIMFPLTLAWRVLHPVLTSIDEVAMLVLRAHAVILRHLLPRNAVMPNVIKETTTTRHG